MKLQKLSVRNVRSIPDGTYEVSPSEKDLDMAMVYGPSACGKTTLLDAIHASLRAIETRGVMRLAENLVRDDAPEGQIETTWRLSDSEAQLAGLDARTATARWSFGVAGDSRVEVDEELVQLLTQHGRGSASAVYFRSVRHLSHDGMRPNRSYKADEILRAGEPEGYDCIPWFLVDLAREHRREVSTKLGTEGAVTRFDAPSPFRTINDYLSTLLPELRLVDAVQGTSGASIVTFARPGGRRVELSQLADSERTALLFAATMSILNTEDSLVLVDAPELGIASANQEGFVHWLRSLVGSNQLLIATGSDAVARAHRKEMFVDLTSRSEGSK